MTELHISGLLLDQIVHRIQTSLEHGADRWATIVANTAGVPRDTDEDGIIRQLDHKFLYTQTRLFRAEIVDLVDLAHMQN